MTTTAGVHRVSRAWSSKQVMLCILLVVLSSCPVWAQDQQIYGKFEDRNIEIDAKELGRIKSKCFFGWGFPTCMPNYQTAARDYDRNLKYYKDLEGLYGANYCLQCCGTQPSHEDRWDLDCEVDVVTARDSSGMHGWELRLAANQYNGDETVVTCPLKRSVCTYDGDTFVECAGEATDPTYLVGYTLTIEINKMDQYFTYTRGVKSCSIEVIEANVRLMSGQTFKELIIMQHSASLSDVFDFSKLGLFLFFLYWITWAVLWYFRRRRCLYCMNKLIFSESMCHRCKFVGAEPPDPILVAALHEKGEKLQGEHPEKFYRSREFVAFYRKKRDVLAEFFSKFKRTHPEDVDYDGEQGDQVIELKDGVFEGLPPLPKDEIDPLGNDDDAATLDTLDTNDKEESKKEKEISKQKTQEAYIKAKQKRDEWEAKQNSIFNKFPFRWKYPRFMTKYMGFSNKRKKKVPKVNPNIIDLPKHIIYEGVGHHNPPKPDEEYIKMRNEIFIEKLGYLPDNLYEDEKSDNGDDSSTVVVEIPEWQKGIMAKVKHERPPTPPKKGIFSIFKSDPHAFKRNRKKRWDDRSCPPMKMLIPAICCMTIGLAILGAVFMLIFDVTTMTNFIGFSLD